MSGTSPLVRQWMLIKLLSVRHLGVTIKEIREELRVSDKTARRDLATLKQAGFPLSEQVGEFGRKTWRLDSRWAKADLSFTFDEALALYLGRRFLEPLAGTLFWEAAQKAFHKVRVSLGNSVLEYVERMAPHFHQTGGGAGDYSAKGDILDELLMSIEERVAALLTYRSAAATEPVTYDVYPYGITFHRGSLYLIGYAPRHEELRHWKVDRIEGAERTELRFERPRDFDLQSHLADSFGIFAGGERVKVRVRFARPVVRYVTESRWHDSQQLAPLADGSLIAEFRLSSTVEVKSWILSFGRHAQVLAPDALRREMAEELELTASLYQTKSPLSGG